MTPSDVAHTAPEGISIEGLLTGSPGSLYRIVGYDITGTEPVVKRVLAYEEGERFIITLLAEIQTVVRAKGVFSAKVYLNETELLHLDCPMGS